MGRSALEGALTWWQPRAGRRARGTPEQPTTKLAELMCAPRAPVCRLAVRGMACRRRVLTDIMEPDFLVL